MQINCKHLNFPKKKIKSLNSSRIHLFTSSAAPKIFHKKYIKSINPALKETWVHSFLLSIESQLPIYRHITLMFTVTGGIQPNMTINVLLSSTGCSIVLKIPCSLEVQSCWISTSDSSTAAIPDRHIYPSMPSRALVIAAHVVCASRCH